VPHPNDLKLDEASAVEGVGQVRFRQGKKEIERPRAMFALRGWSHRRRAMTGVDDSKNRKSPEGLTQTWPADVENLNQVALRREPVTGAEHARSDKVEDAIDD
jgi:hypothetical protein